MNETNERRKGYVCGEEEEEGRAALTKSTSYCSSKGSRAVWYLELGP